MPAVFFPAPRAPVPHHIRPDVVEAARATSPIAVSWDWFDQSQGVVQWTFRNDGETLATCVLLRNGYYFAGAFWPIYLANPGFNMKWATALTPLVDTGVQSNSPPVGIVQFADGNRQVMFLITLSPGQSWSMLEVGFSSVMPPVFQAAPLVSMTGPAGPMCIGYDPKQVTDWDSQTGTNLQGYSPNPSTFTALLLSLDPAAPDIRLYPGDSAQTGACGNSTPPSPTPQPGSCIGILSSAATAFEQGQVMTSLEDVFDFIFCLVDTGVVGLKDVVHGLMRKLRSRL